MSRGFVKEDDQEEVPLVPPRADLPERTTNYVTQTGMDELLSEKQSLTNEQKNLIQINEKEKRIASNFITAKLQLLSNRIASAKIIDLRNQPKDEIRFGATVSLQIGTMKQLQKYQIVGVDEADIAKQKIAFISPIAKLLIGKRVGESAILKLATENRTFKIEAISYL